MNKTDHLFAVILAGGGGTRLWPKSREASPKQFLRLSGKDTMMQVAAARVTKLVSWERVIVVTNEKYRDEVHQQLPQVPLNNIICEPKKRDTAMAMLAGALFAYSQDPDAVVINSASDHVVTDENEFVRVMDCATDIAAEGSQLVAIGITPSYPSSGFGYIKVGEEIRKLAPSLTVFKVDSFTEKPNIATARAFISTGKYFWNANMYVWSAAVLMNAFEKYMPKMAEQAKPLASAKNEAFHEILPQIYEQVESISIDYAISEKANNLVLIPGDFGWNDVGDWKVVYELGTKDLQGNVIIGDGETMPTLMINAQNNLVHVDGRLVAMIGLSDFIVVDTPEILMIVPKDQSQDVKKLVERLKEAGKKEYL